MRLAILFAASALWLAGPDAQASSHCATNHHGCHCGGHHHGGPGAAGPVYDPDTVSTLRGTATAVMVVPGGGGRQGGTHVTLDHEGRSTEVHVGPSWFIESKGVTIGKGDSLEVTGSLVEGEGGPFVIAREIKKGDQILRLRDDRGLPVWSRRGP